jgi:hypothetical protein
MPLKMYLDDIRNPKTTGPWIVLRTSQEAIDYVKEFGMPSEASFDHDLGGDDTVMIFLKWLIDYDLDNNGAVIPTDFSWMTHSSNPNGKDNIDGLLKSFLNFRQKK